MALVSEGTFYKAKIAPSYVSSSGYYGYVPPCPIANYENIVAHNNQLGSCGDEANDQKNRFSWSLSVPSAIQQQQQQQQQQQAAYHQQHNNQQELLGFNGSAMETDDDDNDNNRVSRCENNRCVIPEAADQLLNTNNHVNQSNGYTVTQSHYGDASSRIRGNRKRNIAGDAEYLAAGQHEYLTKKSRQDGGNCNVCGSPGSSGKYRSASMHYEPRSLSSTGSDDFCRLNGEYFFTKCAKKCAETLGNYDSIDDANLELPGSKLMTNGDDNFVDSYLDYEKMLMETHGCSFYHYQRHRQFDIDVLEADL